MSALDPASVACVARTRSAILNVMVAVGCGIAASGVILSRRDRGALLWPDRNASRWAHGALIALIAISFVVRRVWGGRAALRDPEKRAARFYWAHVASAIVGALALPMGFAYAWAVRPKLDAISAFWVTALALGVLAWPRDSELEGFELPMNQSGQLKP
jgi:hypothetical protein